MYVSKGHQRRSTWPLITRVAKRRTYIQDLLDPTQYFLKFAFYQFKMTCLKKELGHFRNPSLGGVLPPNTIPSIGAAVQNLFSPLNTPYSSPWIFTVNSTIWDALMCLYGIITGLLHKALSDRFINWQICRSQIVSHMSGTAL